MGHGCCPAVATKVCDMNRRAALALIALIAVAAACTRNNASSTTSYSEFRVHVESAKAGAIEAGFGPGWGADEARKYAAAEVEWMTAHPPDACYALLRADILSVFQSHASGEFDAPPPPGMGEHLRAAEAAC